MLNPWAKRATQLAIKKDGSLVAFPRLICYTENIKPKQKESVTVVKIAICDDEKPFRGAAESILRQYMEENEHPATCGFFSESADLLDTLESGVICDGSLLGIYMPGVTGICIATELRSRGVKESYHFPNLLYRPRPKSLRRGCHPYR